VSKAKCTKETNLTSVATKTIGPVDMPNPTMSTMFLFAQAPSPPKIAEISEVPTMKGNCATVVTAKSLTSVPTKTTVCVDKPTPSAHRPEDTKDFTSSFICYKR
jgi:hypothetical protein